MLSFLYVDMARITRSGNVVIICNIVVKIHIKYIQIKQITKKKPTFCGVKIRECKSQ